MGGAVDQDATAGFTGEGMVMADAPEWMEGDFTTAVGANLAAVIEDTNAVLTVAADNRF